MSIHFTLNHEAIRKTIETDLKSINQPHECAVDLIMAEFLLSLAKEIPEAKEYIGQNYGGGFLDGEFLKNT